jgi:hypothetical protein
MAFEGDQTRLIGCTASADLSAKQFCFVKFSAARTVTVCSATTDKPIGILQNKPTSGHAATVATSGVSKVVVGSTVSNGDSVGTDSNGKAATYTASDTTKHLVGQVQIANSAANGLATIDFDCRNTRTLA